MSRTCLTHVSYYIKYFFFFFVDRRDGQTIINSHTQSGDTGVQTPIMTSDLTISTFLPVELGLMRHHMKYLTHVRLY